MPEFFHVANLSNWVCDGVVLAIRLMSFALNLNRIHKVEPMLFSRTIANTMLAKALIIRCLKFVLLYFQVAFGRVNKVDILKRKFCLRFRLSHTLQEIRVCLC